MRSLLISALLATCCYSQEVPNKKAGTDEPSSVKPRRIDSRTALERLNVLIGEWRGVGQPKRGSRQGAWSEQSHWVWDFSNKKVPALSLATQRSRQIRSLRIEFDSKLGQYVMTAALGEDPKQKPVVLTAKPDAKKLVFNQKSKGSAETLRISLRILSEKRVTLLVEKGKTRFSRAFGVGYTRAGTSIVGRGDGKPVCVVTGGTASIRVTHKGKPYYVCCSGCQQAFADDPEGVLADFVARKKAEQEAKKKRLDAEANRKPADSKPR